MSTAPSDPTTALASPPRLGWARREADVAALTASLDGSGFEVVDRLLVAEGTAARERVEFVDRTSPGVTHLVIVLHVPGDESLARYASRPYHHAAGEPRRPGSFGPFARTAIAGFTPYRREAAPNTAYSALRDRVLAADPRTLAVLRSRETYLDVDVKLALDLGEVDLAAVETTVALLEDLASGTPLEWALRRAEADS